MGISGRQHGACGSYLPWCPMSRETLDWAFQQAPDVPPQCVAVLAALAHAADKHGRAAYLSANTLARFARKSKRQVHYDLQQLTDLKLIRLGDQSHVAKFPVNRRPVVYDLATELSGGGPPICVYCGDPADTTDHVIPMSRGGTNLPANRVPACGRCNSSKRDLTLEEWIATGRAPAMALGVKSASPQGVQSTSPQAQPGVQWTAPDPTAQSTAPQTPPDLQEHLGVKLTSPQGPESLGCNTAQPGVQSTADKLNYVNQQAKPSSRPRRDLNADRPDVDRLCDHLAKRIAANGYEDPEITKDWRDAARLMLDADKRRVDQIHKAIDWCQANEFWRKNIRSMPKLREQYVRLQMEADEERKNRRRQWASIPIAAA